MPCQQMCFTRVDPLILLAEWFFYYQSLENLYLFFFRTFAERKLYMCDWRILDLKLIFDILRVSVNKLS